jgi:hypothetical protein
MNARKVFVFGPKLEMRMLGAADQERIAPIEGEFFPLMRPGYDRQDDAHAFARPRRKSGMFDPMVNSRRGRRNGNYRFCGR